MKTVTRFFSILIFIVGFVNLTYSQNFATAKLDSAKIEMGDQVGLTLQVTSTALNVRFPQLNDTIIGGVEIISKSGIDTLHKGANGVVLMQRFVIQAFEDSTYAIPPFKFLLGNDSLLSNALTLQVGKPRIDKQLASKIDTTHAFVIFDVKTPIDAPWTFKEFLNEYLPYLLVLLLIAGGVYLFYYFQQKRKNNQPLLRFEKPKEPAHVTALRKLDELKEKKLWQRGFYKEFHSELTEIVRVYIEGRFNIYAMELTSYELLSQFKNQTYINDECYKLLSDMLLLADFAKFAKAEPLPNENELSLQNAYSFVIKTKSEVVLQQIENQQNTDIQPST